MLNCKGSFHNENMGYQYIKAYGGSKIVIGLYHIHSGNLYTARWHFHTETGPQTQTLQ